ncbi:hypothetical protein J4Q44_G00362700 [Coregonus suidteri]|uniref:DNA-directed RNA polymerase III subunit RPC4 n=1 Tax=Coregonus suidteri TaxID=861788 RepID=A0AAN8Q787_9TELE
MTDPSSNTDFMAAYSGITRPNGAGCGLPRRTVLNSPPPHGRLTSLRSRDLTLGGFKKKTFVPNVHSLRKSKDELKEEAHVAPKDRREREERPRESRVERRERPPQTIQSHSIFEQGPAGTIRKAGGWRGTDLRDSGSSPGAKCFKKERRASEEDDNDMLQKLQRDDPTTASAPSQPTTATGQPIIAPEKNAKKDSKSDGKRSSHIKAPDPAGKDIPVLSEFTEGILGKLQIRKSGKVQLLLGDITMDVSEGTAFSFLQQLVSVRLSEGLTGDMRILGNVKHKLVCSPDFQALLQEPSPHQSAHL